MGPRTGPASHRYGRGPLRWRLAGRLAASLPEVRGRDRVVGWVQGATDGYAGPLRGRFVNGMLFDVDSCRDGSARALSALRYRPPALAPVFADRVVAALEHRQFLRNQT
jgi:hypothetical protein